MPPVRTPSLKPRCAILRNWVAHWISTTPANLVGVDLAGDRVSLSDADIPCLLAVPHLKQLKLSGAAVTNVGLRQVASISGLAELSLLDAQIDDAGLRQLTQLKNLSSLSIRRSSQVTDRGAGLPETVAQADEIGPARGRHYQPRSERNSRISKQLRLLDLRGTHKSAIQVWSDCELSGNCKRFGSAGP